MNIKPIHANFKVPTKGTTQAGAYDRYMPEAGRIEADTLNGVLYGLGFAAEVPEGHVALLLPRSGVGAKFGLDLNNTCGVIDSDYRGEWMVKLRTKSGMGFSWDEGERLIQMLIVPVAVVEKFNIVDSLEASDRGEGGFGSSGK